MKRIVCLGLILCLLITGLTACGDDGSGRGFRFPLSGEPRQLDPQVATDRAAITMVSVLFEGLTKLDDQGTPIPGMAQWTVSEDGLTYTFKLKESYWSTQPASKEKHLWENPVAVTADDFVFGMQRALDPATGSALGKELYAIRNAKQVHAGEKSPAALGVKAEDYDTLIITLEQPDDSFLATLATTPCMPCNREFFNYTAGRYGLEKQYLLTNGAFQLTAWNHGSSLLLNKHEDYYDAAKVAPAAVRFVMDSEDAAADLTEGLMDVAPLTAQQAAAYADEGIQTVVLQDTIRQLWFNTRREALADAAIRCALRDSVEWDTVYAHLQETGEPIATGYVAPAAALPDGTLYRQDSNAHTYQLRAETANAALGQGLAALYPEQTAPTLPRLTLLAGEDAVSANLARYLVQSWQKHLHLSINLQLLSDSALAASVAGGNYDIALYTHTATGLTGAENLATYASDNAANLTGLSDATVDAAILAAQRGGREELESLENRLLECCPSIPLSFPHRYYGIAKGDEGITVRPFGGGQYSCPYSFQNARKWD